MLQSCVINRLVFELFSKKNAQALYLDNYINIGLWGLR